MLLVTSAVTVAEPTKVSMETTAGAIVLQLDAERAPLTVRNFLMYVKEGHYESTIFHRVIAGFVIQGGGYTKALAIKDAPRAVPNESGNGLSNRRGTIAMARSNEPHSADSQFYINLADNVVTRPQADALGIRRFRRSGGGNGGGR